MRQPLTEAVGGTALAICVQHHHCPYGYPSWALRDHSRGWRGGHNTWELGTPPPRLVARPLHASNVGLHLPREDIAPFRTRPRCQRLPTVRAVFGPLAHVMHCDPHP